MKKILLTAAIILAAVVCGNAESRTFVREYYYQAGESDSKITSRTKALTGGDRGLPGKLHQLQ